MASALRTSTTRRLVASSISQTAPLPPLISCRLPHLRPSNFSSSSSSFTRTTPTSYYSVFAPSRYNTTTTRKFSSTTSKMVAEIKSTADYNSKVGNKDKLAVIDFHATWCGPCKAIAPQIEKYSKQYADVEFYKIDVDEVPDVAQQFGVRAMPTFKFVKNGNVVGEVVGANPKAVQAAIEQHK